MRGRPFKKGRSGNPGGRPKVVSEIQALAREKSPGMIEILEEIARHGLSYVEVPCTIIYTSYSKAKGQRMSGAFAILFDLYIRRLYR